MPGPQTQHKGTVNSVRALPPLRAPALQRRRDVSGTHAHPIGMGKETAILDLSSQQDWSAVARLLKDSGTKISSKQINRVGRCASQPPPRQPIQALLLTTAVRSAPAGTG